METELQILVEYLTDKRRTMYESPDNAAAIAPQPVAGIPQTELAAWTGVCSVILNLHEFLPGE